MKRTVTRKMILGHSSGLISCLKSAIYTTGVTGYGHDGKNYSRIQKRVNFEVLEKNPTSNSSRNKSSNSSEKRLKFLVNERWEKCV